MTRKIIQLSFLKPLIMPNTPVTAKDVATLGGSIVDFKETSNGVEVHLLDTRIILVPFANLSGVLYKQSAE